MKVPREFPIGRFTRGIWFKVSRELVLSTVFLKEPNYFAKLKYTPIDFPPKKNTINKF